MSNKSTQWIDDLKKANGGTLPDEIEMYIRRSQAEMVRTNAELDYARNVLKNTATALEGGTFIGKDTPMGVAIRTAAETPRVKL